MAKDSLQCVVQTELGIKIGEKSESRRQRLLALIPSQLCLEFSVSYFSLKRGSEICLTIVLPEVINKNRNLRVILDSV